MERFNRFNQSIKKNKKKKQIALPGSRKVSNYVVFVGVEWPSVCSYCGVRQLCARKQPPLLHFGFEFSFNLLPRTCPLAFEMQRDVRRESIQILFVFVGWRKVPDDTLSSSWLFSIGSLSFCLRHQALERNPEDLGCFLQPFFLCT